MRSYLLAHVTNEQSVVCGKCPLMYVAKEAERLFKSSGSLPWVHIKIIWGILKNTEAPSLTPIDSDLVCP